MQQREVALMRSLRKSWIRFLKWQERSREPGLTALMLIEGTLIFGIIPLGDILADSGYAHRTAEGWAIPLRAAGAHLIFANPLFLKPCSAAVFLPFLKQHFPHLVENGESPRSPLVYECTLYIVPPAQKSREANRAAKARLLGAAVEWSLNHGLAYLQTVIDSVTLSSFVEMTPQTTNSSRLDLRKALNIGR